MKLLKSICYLLPLLLAACGYHLVGQGGDAGLIETGELVHVQADNEQGKILVRQLKVQLQRRGYTLVDSSSEAKAQLHIQHASEKLSPTAYDASGLAVQYRLTIQADASLWRGGEEVWREAAINASGDIFASGGPSDVDAQQRTVSHQLQQSWVRECVARLQSGF